MNSSISSSEATAEGAATAWGRWLVYFLGTLALGCALVLAFVLVVDPYDSGRVGLLGIKGVRDESPRTATASRARDPAFDAAVIGNSTGQLLKPAELSQLTGARFVQLTIPGTGPREQLAVLRFFVRNHPRIGALVIVTNDTWCQRDPALPLTNPFPFWLYGDSTLSYVGRLFSRRALDHSLRRVGLAAGLGQPSAPDGYWDYEARSGGEFHPVIASQDELAAPPDGVSSFPAVVLLETAIKALSADVPVVIVVPPGFYTTVPRPGSAAAIVEAACHSALRRLVAGRPRSNFIDYHVDNAVTREPANFLDIGHYRAGIARRMERGIADSIRLGDKAVIDF
jgi:hypothetical protein